MTKKEFVKKWHSGPGRGYYHSNFPKNDNVTMEEDLDKITKEIENDLQIAIKLLSQVSCPHCDGSGAIPHMITISGHRQISETEFEEYPIEECDWEQCQWCDEKNRITK